MADSISCKSLDGYQVQIKARSHSRVADLPPEKGGSDQGPSPFEILLESLGACTVITIRHCVSQVEIPLEDISVQLDGHWVKENDEKKYHIKVTLQLRGDLSDKDLERIRRASDRCPVHKILEHGTVIETEIHAA